MRLALSAFGMLLAFAGEDAYAPGHGPLVLQACEAPPAIIEEVVLEAAEAALALEPAQQALAGYLARRFRLAAEPIERMVETAHRAAEETALDPLLVLAVISVESAFNPIAESRAGARGLMQIIPRYHRDKLAAHGEHAVLDPEINIRTGARILREYIERAGTLEAGLQFYNGASGDRASRYARKVIAERERLARALPSEG